MQNEILRFHLTQLPQNLAMSLLCLVFIGVFLKESLGKIFLK